MADVAANPAKVADVQAVSDAQLNSKLQAEGNSPGGDSSSKMGQGTIPGKDSEPPSLLLTNPFETMTKKPGKAASPDTPTSKTHKEEGDGDHSLKERSGGLSVTDPGTKKLPDAWDAKPN